MTENAPDGGKSDGCIDHTDPETLRRLYHEEGLSTVEIGDRAGVHHQTVNYHMEKHGIDRRTPTEARRVERANFKTGERGYEYWNEWNAGDQHKVYVHQLLAVAEYGYQSVRDMEVHHANELKWDNRPENIELLTTADHRREHIGQLNGD